MHARRESPQRVMVLTGFGTWGDVRCNSSWESVWAARPCLPSEWRCRRRRMRVSWARATRAVDTIAASDARVVIAFGRRSKGHTVRIERIAANLVRTDLTDADGRRAARDVIAPGGAAGYWTGLPTDRILGALSAEGIPCGWSPNAGGFLCNLVFYLLARAAEERRRPLTIGFVHVPPFDDEDGLPRDALRRSVEIITEQTVAAVDETPR